MLKTSRALTHLIALIPVGGLSLALAMDFARGQAPARSATGTAQESGWNVPDIDQLPGDDWGRTVRYGRDLVAKTASLIGPEVSDPARRFAGNNLNCQSCHIDAGTRKFGLPFKGVYADFPNYRARSGTVGTVEDRVQGCMVRSMNGKQLPPDGPEMTAIVAYLKFLSSGQSVGAPTDGRGPGKMPELSRAADPIRGQQIYAQNCVSCHGEQGQGQRAGAAGDSQGYAFPPLWGPDSFNDGAGMARLIDAANFIRNNMPDGTTWQQPVLSPEDAWDVAAFVESHSRPHKENLEKDYPNRLQKPLDSPYGPYADTFQASQHKFGPFAPIREAIKKLAADQRQEAASPPSNSQSSAAKNEGKKP